MAKEEYDIIIDSKKRINEPHNRSYELAKTVSEAGNGDWLQPLMFPI